MISRLLLTSLLLHYCLSHDAERTKRNLAGDSRSARRRDASLRGQPRIDASIDDASGTVKREQDVTGQYGERREPTADGESQAQAAVHESANRISSSIEEPGSRIERDMSDERPSQHERLPNDPLHVTESLEPQISEQELTDLRAKKLAARALATHPEGIPYRVFHPSTISLSYILSQKALRKECHLVTIELFWESLQQSRETSWMVTLGSLDDLEGKHLPYYIQEGWGDNSGEGMVVEFSHRQYYQPFERHAFCLPGEGVYTFTIFDWGGDGIANTGDSDDEFGVGSYVLYSSDGRTILSGGAFNYMESQEFTLPLPPLETESPSVSPAPTVSAAPTMDCDWIDINILYDMYPEETTWMVILGDYSSLDNGNITIIEQSTVESGLGEGFTVNVGAAGGSTMTRRMCLPGEGTYSFVIFDSYYNGICCEFGDGSYTITTPSLPGEILGQGGEFTTFDIATFKVPFVKAPSASPSTSPYPTISQSPTVDCKFVELEIKFDAYSSETSWKFSKQATGDEEVLVLESPFYSDPDYGGVYTILSICLPGDGVYTFTMEDKAGDGICCLYGDGSYTLTYKGDGQESLEIVNGGEFSYDESATFAVPYGSTTLAPTLTPAPSTKCYNVEVSITFDQYPYETIWLIAKGGLDSSSLSEDASFETVVESPKYNFGNLNTTDVHVECLPEGTYTFLIVDSDGICCSFGDGQYMVTVTKKNGKEVVIKQGGEFTSVESVTFDLPFVLGSSPTMPPETNGVAPTPAEGTSRFWVDIELNFDSLPYQISWMVTDDQSNIIEESPFYTMFYKDGSESHRVYLPAAGEYSFTILDKGGNGMCCSFGSGNYQVTAHDDLSGDVVIAQGSDFGSEDSVSFSLQGQGSSSMWPTPFQGWVSSMWPTPLPSPPPIRETSSPTVTGCIPVNIELSFDVFPYDTHWWLVEGDLKTFENRQPHFIGKSPIPAYDEERFANVTHSFCLGEGKYSFMIFDDGGNGMCCKSGDGSYTLTYGEDNQEFASGGKFGFFDAVVFEVPFPTRSPSWTPVPTTSMPTSSSPTTDTPAPSIGSSIPDCDILLHLTTDTDGDQNAIRWEVALGDQSSVSNAFALIVAQSEQATYSISSVSERTTDSDRVCLPGEGQYTFTIFDSSGADDTRYRLVVDGALVAYGSSFGYQESTTFSVPVTGQPTPAPQSADATPAPADCTMIDISITFDDFPDETYWAVYVGNADGLDDAVIVATSPFYSNVTANSTSELVCLPGDGEYTFVISDVANDGMCCNFGKGSYVVSSVDEPIVIIASGAEFTDSEIATFSVPIMIAPSVAPSVTPRPTESSSPTAKCSTVDLTVTFDAYPSETAWELFDADNNTIAKSPFYPNSDFANGTVDESFCLPDGSYTFLLTDQAGDGNCCVGLGDGSYSLVYQDGVSEVVIVDDGPDPTFVYYDMTEFTVPYVIPPTKSPTISPAPTESLAPTASCIQMEVVINFDAYPFDTLWEITVGDTNSWDNSNAIVAVDSPIYSSTDLYSTTIHSISLPGGATYTFSVFDGTGNGMCCDEGSGGFILLMLDDNGDREIVAEGAEFEWRLSTQFDLPFSVGPRIDNTL